MPVFIFTGRRLCAEFILLSPSAAWCAAPDGQSHSCQNRGLSAARRLTPRQSFRPDAGQECVLPKAPAVSKTRRLTPRQSFRPDAGQECVLPKAPVSIKDRSAMAAHHQWASFAR